MPDSIPALKITSLPINESIQARYHTIWTCFRIEICGGKNWNTKVKAETHVYQFNKKKSFTIAYVAFEIF